MKFGRLAVLPRTVCVSHPTRGAWIEMPHEAAVVQNKTGSHPTRGAWIEITAVTVSPDADEKSHPTRGAWIEIHLCAANR